MDGFDGDLELGDQPGGNKIFAIAEGKCFFVVFGNLGFFAILHRF